MEGPANGQPWMAANTDRRPIAAWPEPPGGS